ncbi:hypothetical protein E9840_03990 [Tissierella creatinini]|nr:hypothetical protein E9840_03990 [Tissierella creatinini]TJX67374.1 hypothetical protein E8P77_05310 [Soehngenia saccharolytica]
MNKINDFSIVTNNPIVKEKYSQVIFVDGGFEDVLIKTRDLVHSGHELINHPLGASIRMFFSPYRSIIVSSKSTELVDNEHVSIMESSIISYRKQMENRMPDIVNSQDYAIIDSELLDSSVEEMKRFYN